MPAKERSPGLLVTRQTTTASPTECGLTRLTRHVNRAAVALDDCLGDGEAEAAACAVRRARFVDLVQPLEHVRHMLGAMPAPVSLTDSVATPSACGESKDRRRGTYQSIR